MTSRGTRIAGDATHGEPASGSLRAALARVTRVLRTVIGAPDYERYLAHVQTRHPTTTPLTRAEFERQRMDDRYNRPGSRCC
jgi:uncharacterized short protein YbdD (DUF466 family)